MLFKDTNRLKVNTQKELCHTNGNHKKDEEAMLLAGKIDFNTGDVKTFQVVCQDFPG